MVHLDLFSGIGGFAYAIDQVWDNTEHVFCDNDTFCQQVLIRHWPGSKLYDDIGSITEPISADIVTGGFPCQPFSHAGKKKGTADTRHLWPEMFRVIRLAQPEWVIAENVYGISTWDGGVVLEQVCIDMESLGYEVQPLIIPAVAVNAPHRRDRVWFLARNPEYARPYGTKNPKGNIERTDSNPEGTYKPVKLTRPNSLRAELEPSWDTDWAEVAAQLCRMDDGLPDRPHRIKALGNAIVPQVAEEIMKAIKYSGLNR